MLETAVAEPAERATVALRPKTAYCVAEALASRSIT
jgi:hypothetical protein